MREELLERFKKCQARCSKDIATGREETDIGIRHADELSEVQELLEELDGDDTEYEDA